MMCWKDIRRNGLIGLLLLAGSCEASAQDANFTAVATTNKIGLQDHIQVTYTIRNTPDLRSIAPVTFPDFEIVQGPFQSSTSSIRIYGKQTVKSTSVSLIYVLRPKHTGNLVIPSDIAKDAAGRSYQSNSLTIQVVSGNLDVADTPPLGSSNPGMHDPFVDNPFSAMQKRRTQEMQRANQQKQTASTPAK